MRITIILFFSAICAGFAQSQPKGKAKPMPLFSVGKSKVSTDEFAYLYRKNHQHKPEDFTSAKVEEYLDLYVNFKLKVMEAMHRGMDTTASFRKEFDQYREEIKRPYVSEGDDLDRLVKEAYQRMLEQVRASHILIMLKADATPADTLAAWNKIADIRNRVIAGEDFVTLAKDFSEEPSAKSGGGDLGYFSAMDMVYPFESAAYQTKVGEISPIVKTRFGYHIIKVLDHRPAAGEVEVSHIMLRTGQGDDAKARHAIFEVSDLLKAGGKWDELCKEYSQDPNTKNNGGRLRQFGMGTFTASAPEFENTAFAMKNPGDVSDPFQTPFGWHVIRLEKKIPLPSFKEAQPGLSRKIARDERLQLSKVARLTSMKNQFKFKEYDEVKKQILSLADSSIQKAKWKYNGSADVFSKTICSIGNKNYQSREWAEYVRINQAANSQSPIAYLTQLYDKWVERLLNQAEEEKLILEKPEFKAMLEEYREGILLFTIMEKEIWNRASNDSIGQRKYYEGNRAKYNAGDRLQARIFATDDKKILEDLKTKIAHGDTLKTPDLKKLKSVSNFRAYEKGDSKVIDKIGWSVGTHESEQDGLFYLIDVAQLIPPGVKTFEEARASIISDYQEQLEKEWVVQLKKKYPVSINSKGKKAVIQEITAKK